MIRTSGVDESGVLEVTFTGRIRGADYEEVLTPAIERALERHPKLRMLALFDEAFTGYDLDAAWDDAKLGIRHWNVWERIAIVTDVPWLRDVVRAAGFLVACPVQGFELAEADEARRWLRESLGSIHLEFDDHADRVTVKLLGKLEPSAYAGVKERLGLWMNRREGVRLMLDLREFDGWQGLGALGEHLGIVRDFREIPERVAVVGEESWQKFAFSVLRNLFDAEVRYFDEHDFEGAEGWLMAGVAAV